MATRKGKIGEKVRVTEMCGWRYEYCYAKEVLTVASVDGAGVYAYCPSSTESMYISYEFLEFMDESIRRGGE